MTKSSVFVNFLTGRLGKDYEYLVPPELYRHLRVGSVVWAGNGLAQVVGLQPEATERATVTIKGLIMGQAVCEDYALLLERTKQRAEALLKKQNLLRELDAVDKILALK